MSIEQINPEREVKPDLSQRLNQFFTDPERFQFKKKLVFSAGTCPMRANNSEIPYLVESTDLDEGTLVDPGYAQAERLAWDLQAIEALTDEPISTSEKQVAPGEKLTVEFQYKSKPRKITFIAGDATEKENMPENFNVYFSGRRVVINDEDLQHTPTEKIANIIESLADGGYVIPDRDLADDSTFFSSEQLASLDLSEIEGIRPEPTTVEKVDQAKFDQLRNQAFEQAIQKGELAPKPLVQTLKFNNGEVIEMLLNRPELEDRISETDEQFQVIETNYKTIDEFFSAHPEFSKTDFKMTEIGLFHKTKDLHIPYEPFSEQEAKILEEIEQGCQTQATEKITQKGIGLYQKASSNK
ncbi:hypothetical protein HN858_00105 [Candidatus Falkowbacteria bacterium]|jgi:hypothetical protein|nr:hypothetical protein [Candidatus Falkowbacteria bacterium]MBT6573507.1 hypothetical protein [Candidatus Falkowbacteria bacterium]MBT7348057.1 hypothetical protein [Candidatus Falkowbacteria bacterium]MBT7501108.1 hypothetical protein [Candidatus Falkowbacteria bacterium]